MVKCSECLFYQECRSEGKLKKSDKVEYDCESYVPIEEA
jgi:hypothetical protein